MKEQILSGALDGALRLLERGKTITVPAFYNHIVTSLYRSYINYGQLPVFIKALDQTQIIARADLVRKRFIELYQFRQSSKLRTSHHRKERKKYQSLFNAKRREVLALKDLVPYFWLVASNDNETNLNHDETIKLIKLLKTYTVK